MLLLIHGTPEHMLHKVMHLIQDMHLITQQELLPMQITLLELLLTQITLLELLLTQITLLVHLVHKIVAQVLITLLLVDQSEHKIHHQDQHQALRILKQEAKILLLELLFTTLKLVHGHQLVKQEHLKVQELGEHHQDQHQALRILKQEAKILLLETNIQDQAVRTQVKQTV